MKFTADEIGQARSMALKLPLHGRYLLLCCSDELVKYVCNGIGPEWFPPKLRELVDKLHPSLKVVAMLHDLEYWFGLMADFDFQDVNSAFRSNGYIIAKNSFGWYNPRRYLVEFDASRFAKYCAIGGRFAYCAAINDRKQTGDKDAASIYDAWSKIDIRDRTSIGLNK